MSYRGTALLLLALCSFAAAAQEPQSNLSDLDLQTLMQMDLNVTTVSKTAQSLYSVAAPIYVITAEDIRRAGARTVPDAIRLAPGVVVGQIDPGKWVVGMRGFAWQYANKALILLDGRGVYTPLNSSVYWNTLDVPMDQIDRIEVIRGPGDARWGSHAVNGIINIITLPASETRGSAASAQLDSNGSTEFVVRHGASLSPDVAYRAYAKYLDQSDYAGTENFPRLGDRAAFRTGLRLDAATQTGDRYSLMADVQSGRDTSILSGQNRVPIRYDADEWSVVSRWERGSAGKLNQQLQLSFDRINQTFYEKRRTLDFSYQAQLPQRFDQTWTFGVTYKNTADRLSAEIGIAPDRATQNIYGVFIHDAIALGEKTRVLLGTQLEHNELTGWEAQPNLQLIYSPAERLSYWASVSRAVRTPLRTEDGFDLEVPISPGSAVLIDGNRDLRAERVLAWQAGVRMGVREDLFVDLAAFYSHYDDLVIQQAGTPVFEPQPPPGRTLFPAVYMNSASANTRGIEAAIKGQPVTQWNVSASASVYSQTRLSDPLGFGSVSAVDHQFQMHSAWHVSPVLQWSVDLYYTGELSTGDVPSYYKLDSELTWSAGRKFVFALGVKNALDRAHVEAGVNSVDTVTWIPRTTYLRVINQF